MTAVIWEKSDSGASPELRSGALCLFSFTRYGERERGEYRLGCSGHALGLSFLCFSYSACSGAPCPGLSSGIPEEPREDRGGRCPDGSSREAPESDFFLITRNRRQREEGGGQSQPEEPGGSQTTMRATLHA